MTFPVPEAVLDWHALAISLPHPFGGQPSLGVGGHQQEPGLLELPLPLDDDVHGFGLLALLEHVAIAGGSTPGVGQAAQTQALPTTPDFRLDDHLAARPEEKGLLAAVQVLD